MDLNIQNKWFLVTGASSGFGRAVSEKLLNEGANVFGVARRKYELQEIQNLYKNKFEFVALDLIEKNSVEKLVNEIKTKLFSGVFVNAGGPPAKSFLETEMLDWDEAYAKLLRWKVDLVKRLIPGFLKQNYGRIVFLESSSVKQPIENLVLSTSLRMSVVGLAKTISQELSNNGITVNVIAPGSHNTSALDRLIQKKSELNSISFEQSKSEFEKNTKVGFLGDPEDLASLAIWLLSPQSKFVTGQTISIAGGAINGVFG